MNEINVSAAALTRNNLCGARLRRAGTAVTRTAMLLLATAGALARAGAAQADGTVVAWGDNNSGQCSAPKGLGAVSAVATGALHTVALQTGGAVVCWGDNTFDQINTPAGLGVVTAIAAGYYHTLALKVNGEVVAWGENSYGQCTTPPALGVVTAIGAGQSHTVALKADGSVLAWGDNALEQCNTPAGIGFVDAIATGIANHTVVVEYARPTCDEQLAAAQAVIATQAAANAQLTAQIVLLNARIAILQIGDVNEDGAINASDLATLLGNWGK